VFVYSFILGGVLGTTTKQRVYLPGILEVLGLCFFVCFVFSTCLVPSPVCAPDGDCHAPAGSVAHEGSAPAFRSAVEPRNPAAAIETTGNALGGFDQCSSWARWLFDLTHRHISHVAPSRLGCLHRCREQGARICNATLSCLVLPSPLGWG
jgi:hypothetical protein